jgi:hypothetical protein
MDHKVYGDASEQTTFSRATNYGTWKYYDAGFEAGGSPLADNFFSYSAHILGMVYGDFCKQRRS